MVFTNNIISKNVYPQTSHDITENAKVQWLDKIKYMNKSNWID